jgi:putative addiction module component (TIGR02574 family)
MTKIAEQLLQQVLSLPPADRADLVDELLANLEPSSDPQYVADWDAEIGRRLHEHEAGVANVSPWEQARDRIFAPAPAKNGADV